MAHRMTIYMLVLGLLLIFSILSCNTQSSSTGPIKWQQPVKIAEGSGYRGPWRMNDSEFHYVDDPTVDLLSDGEIGIGWVEQAQRNIVFQRIKTNGERRFESPVNVSKTPNVFSWLPDMHMDRGIAGNPDSLHVYMLWQEIVFSGGTHGGEAFFARSTDGGRSFGEPVNLSNSIAGDGKGRLTQKFWHNGSLDLLVAPDGTLYAAWTEYEGRLWVSRSTDRGRSFSDPLLVGGDNEQPARGPSLAVDTAGTVYLAWTYGEHPQANLLMARSRDQGRSFSSPETLVTNPGHSDAPKIAIDAENQLHLTYSVSPGGPFKIYEVRYQKFSLPSLSTTQTNTFTTPGYNTYEMGHFPSVILSNAGNVFLNWELYKNAGARPEALAFSYSPDGGKTFISPYVLPGSGDPDMGTNGSQQGYLLDKLAVNEQGDIAVVNSTFQRGRKSRIWLFRGKLQPE